MAKKKEEAVEMKITRVLAAQRNIERLEKEGWKKADLDKGGLDKKLLDNLKNNKDLTLMEKEI